MKCLQKYWNNAIDVYSYCYENVVICVHIMFLLSLLLIHILFFCFKVEPIMKRKKKWKEEFYKMHQGICLKSSYKVFMSSLHIKFSCQVLMLKSLYQVFVSRLQIKSIKSLYQVYVSSLRIKSSYQVFVSSLRIKSKWWNKYLSKTMLRSSRCFVILLLCFSLGVKKYLF